MNILIAPDKFKYSLTAKEVCEAVEKGIRKYMPSANIIKIPLADGGEGSLETLENTIKFERVYLKVKNPVFKSIKTFYGILKDTAYIEMS
ncbi:MAG: glycerate kinase, partial [Ignavibacteriae bacterium HGW-Ignavibacteriae-2]